MFSLVCKYEDKYLIKDTETSNVRLLSVSECSKIPSNKRDFKVTKTGVYKKVGFCYSLKNDINYFTGDITKLQIPFIDNIGLLHTCWSSLDFTNASVRNLLAIEGLEVVQTSPLMLKNDLGLLPLANTSTGLRVLLTALYYLIRNEFVCLDVTECYGKYVDALYKLCWRKPILLYNRVLKPDSTKININKIRG